MKTRALLALGALLLAGCATFRAEDLPPDARFGHRVEGTDDEGRETIVISAPLEGQSFLSHNAVYESVTVRPSPVTPDTRAVAVEVLVKGAFPDGCTTLHDVNQSRAGNLIQVTLLMRRPQGAMCAAVLRPYRFYLALEGLYEPGPYSLTLNGDSHPFEIRAASN